METNVEESVEARMCPDCSRILKELEATWGNIDATLKLIEKVATRKGVENILAE